MRDVYVEFQFITFWSYCLSKKPTISVVLIFLITVVGLYFITNEIVETEKAGVAKSHEECPTVPVSLIFNFNFSPSKKSFLIPFL